MFAYLSQLGAEEFQKACGLTLDRFLWLKDELHHELATTPLQDKHKEKKRLGRPRTLTHKDQLLLLFCWLRHYPSEHFLGLFFHIKQSLVSRYLNTTLKIVYHYFQQLDLIRFPDYPAREKDGVWLEGELFTLVIDCTEQPQPDATNKHEAIARASGKKRCPTWTKLVGCAPQTAYIYSLSPSYLGSNNDPMVYKRAENMLHTKLRKHEVIAGDSAFAFIRRWHPVRTTRLDQSEEAKHYNQSFVPMRLIIENLFRHLKQRWNVLHDTFTHGQESHHRVWHLLCSLHNLEIIEDGKMLRDKESWRRWEKKCLDKAPKKKEEVKERVRKQKRRQGEVKIPDPMKRAGDQGGLTTGTT